MISEKGKSHARGRRTGQAQGCAAAAATKTLAGQVEKMVGANAEFEKICFNFLKK